ncbi:SGNH/GDSL hydrolase family protein [Massilia consociata]|uniref:SGNH/GDSL hydrolase family protein n=1 Tax=Massilia consociata TaxID=760117 RepID=A0ABV6FI02_9BURK
MSNNKATYLGRRRGWLTMLAIALSGCGGGGGGDPISGSATVPASVVTPAVAQISSGTWVVMGSSTAAGAGAPAGKGWVDLLQAATASRGAQFANIAVGGSVTYHGLSASAPAVSGRPSPNLAANIDQALLRKPVALIVSYPSNDTALGYSTEETVNNILSIRTKALAASVPVIVMSTQPRSLSDAQLEKLRMIDQHLAKSIGTCFVDVRTTLAGGDGRLAPQYDSGDGVHPNSAAHFVIAAEVEKMLNQEKCIGFVKN